MRGQFSWARARVHSDEARAFGCRQALEDLRQRKPRNPQSGIQLCELDGQIQGLFTPSHESIELHALTLQMSHLCHPMTERRNLSSRFG